MVIDTINEYLQHNRRLVVPSFGAFVVKESGDIIFSELLKRDDGVLRGLLVAKGLREIEAAGKVDRFIFEVRHALQDTGICPVAGLGTFRKDAEGVILFDCAKPEVVPIPMQPVRPVQPAANMATPSSAAQPTPPPMATPRPRPRPQKGGNYTLASKGILSRGIMWFVGLVIAGALIALGYGVYCMATAPEMDIDAQMDAQRIPMMEIPQSTDSK